MVVVVPHGESREGVDDDDVGCQMMMLTMRSVGGVGADGRVGERNGSGSGVLLERRFELTKRRRRGAV